MRRVQAKRADGAFRHGEVAVEGDAVERDAAEGGFGETSPIDERFETTFAEHSVTLEGFHVRLTARFREGAQDLEVTPPGDALLELLGDGCGQHRADVIREGEFERAAGIGLNEIDQFLASPAGEGEALGLGSPIRRGRSRGVAKRPGVEGGERRFPGTDDRKWAGSPGEDGRRVGVGRGLWFG
jgi:hypothetical protein